MLTTKQMERYAEVLLWGLARSRTRRYKKEDLILLRYDPAATPLAEIVYKKLLQAGRLVVLRSGLTPVMEHDFFDLANDRQLSFQPPGDKALLQALNGLIALPAPTSLTHLSTVSPRKIGRAAAARKPLRDILNKREAAGDFGWTLAMYPTQALADHAGLSLADYAKQIARSCFLDRKEPLTHWQEVFKKATRIKKRLNRMEIAALRVESRHMDLTVVPGHKRRWLGVSGHNIPSFEIFTSPDCRYTEGVYWADMPAYRDGNYIKNLRLEFKAGRAVSIDAEQGQNFARQLLATDPGAAYIGEFSLTDKRFSKIQQFMANTLYDENFGGRQGNCHIALGAAYADTYAGPPAELTKTLKSKLGFNDSAIHWDVINTEKKRVTAKLKSGRTKIIYENGAFVD